MLVHYIGEGKRPGASPSSSRSTAVGNDISKAVDIGTHFVQYHILLCTSIKYQHNYREKERKEKEETRTKERLEKEVWCEVHINVQESCSYYICYVLYSSSDLTIHQAPNSDGKY